MNLQKNNTFSFEYYPTQASREAACLVHLPANYWPANKRSLKKAYSDKAILIFLAVPMAMLMMAYYQKFYDVFIRGGWIILPILLLIFLAFSARGILGLWKGRKQGLSKVIFTENGILLRVRAYEPKNDLRTAIAWHEITEKSQIIRECLVVAAPTGRHTIAIPISVVKKTSGLNDLCGFIDQRVGKNTDLVALKNDMEMVS